MTLTEELGIKRRDDPALYEREWRSRNREKNNAYHRDYYHNRLRKDPEAIERKRKSGRASNKMKKYGLSRLNHEKMLTAQEGRCMICDEYKGDKLDVDHDHATGEIRGLLCNACNRGLAGFRDRPELLANAIWYLTRPTRKSE